MRRVWVLAAALGAGCWSTSGQDAGPCEAVGYTCGPKSCLSDPCLPDGGCAVPTPLTGSACSAGVCRNDAVCVALGSEFDCANDADDNADGIIDCLDATCVDVPCSSADKCRVATRCQADAGCDGAPKACPPPPGDCFGPGVCDSATGDCSYSVQLTNACSDSNACTTGEVCLPDGGCANGAPVVCNTPPAPTICHATTGTCDPATGCAYAVFVGLGCDDGDLCTVADQCRPDGGCAGTSTGCVTNQCVTAICLAGGGCSRTPHPGTPCDGGVCTAAGTCFAASNFDPSAIPAGAIAAGSTLSCAAAFNSDDAGIAWCGQPAPTPRLIAQPGGGELVVLPMQSFAISGAGSLRLVGHRPVALAVFGDATIDGVLSAASDGVSTGTGAALNCTAGIGAAFIAGGGGGGGGFGGIGGIGGSGASGSAGAAGSVAGGADLFPLRGGCAGGAGGINFNPSGSSGQGGWGGGAVQVSAAGTLLVRGTVTASGAGGYAGAFAAGASNNGGGGGGSGGAVLLEGHSVRVAASARLTANGGGGGAGSSNSGTAGANGEAGATSTAVPALGGLGAGGAGGSGGTSSAGTGSGGNSASVGGGGGGGAVGRIRINFSSACQVDAGVQSPVPAYSAACP